MSSLSFLRGEWCYGFKWVLLAISKGKVTIHNGLQVWRNCLFVESAVSFEPMTEKTQSETRERLRDLKCRLHDCSSREQLMMLAAKQADVHLCEYPELGYFFPDLHVDVKSCRAALVRFLFSKVGHFGSRFMGVKRFNL